MYTRECRICGREFKCIKKKQFLCGDEVCRKEWQKIYYQEQTKPHRKKKTKPIIKTCKTCGKEFLAKGENNVYCSDECRYLNNAEKNRDAWIEKIEKEQSRKVYVFNCANCGREFKTLVKNRRYCSKPECRRARKEKNLNRYRAKERADSNLAEKTLDEYQKTHTHKKVKPTWDSMSGEDLLHYGRVRAEQYRQTGRY